MMTNDEFTMPNEWIEVCIESWLDPAELLSLLDDPHVQGAWEEAGLIRLYWPQAQWNADRLAAVRRLLHTMDPNRGGESPLVVTGIPYQDWNEQWALSVQPLRIGRVVIRPSWKPLPLGSNDIEIVLDPKQAFGTGHHATTRMLLEWLQEGHLRDTRVLDVGTGSAILAMAAVRLGARSAIGVECDPVAAACAREYVQGNRLHDRIELLCGTLGDLARGGRPPIDLVLANLDRQTLLGLAEELELYGEAGATLWCSGLLSDQADEIVERFAGLGLVCRRRREQEGWVALELIQPESCEGMAE